MTKMKFFVFPDYCKTQTVNDLQPYIKDRIINAGDIVEIDVPEFDSDLRMQKAIEKSKIILKQKRHL